MRILRIAQKVHPEHTGGGAYHVHAMSRDQASMGHDVTVLTVGDGPRREARDGYSVVRCPSRFSALGNDIAPDMWHRLRDAAEYDVVHAHSHIYASTNMAALRRRFGETPLAITNHGLYSQNAPEWLFDWYLRTVGRWTFDAADVVFCYTNEDRERLRGLGISSSVEVVHNGIDTDQFTPDGQEHSGVIGDPAVLFVGRLVEGKRPGDALEAVAHLRERFPEAGLTFCGEGPMRPTLADHAAELDIVEGVRFLGHIPYDEMPSVYRAGDALVLPSRAEGLPRTVLEAMASGVPVVVSDLEQLRSVVDGAGETVPFGDTGGFARGLERVLEEYEGEPRSIVVSQFDWRDTVERTTATLRRLG